MKKENKSIILWLLSGCFLIFIMVIVGGITRLTNSGLSMTDWHLVTDTFPPLTEAKWVEAFEQYKQFPEYQKLNVYSNSLMKFKMNMFKLKEGREMKASTFSKLVSTTMYEKR